MAPHLLSVTPLLHVISSERAAAYYRDQLGFTKEWEYRPGGPSTEPGYIGIERDGVRLHLSSFRDDGVVGGVVGFSVRDVDDLFTELKARGATITLSPTDQTWGNREMYVRDPDGNALRFCQAMK